MAEGDNVTAQPAGNQPAPGQVITPGGTPPSAAAQPVQPAPPLQPVEPAPSVPPVQAAPPQSEPPATPAPPAPEPPSESLFVDEGVAPVPDNLPAGEVSWTASEFIAHDKAASWYLGLAAVALIIAGFVYLITRDIISSAVVLVGAFALGILAARKPRQLQYQLSTRGVTVGSKYYDLSSFRSFSVVPEGAFSSVVFMPMKRFAPLLTIYYAPKDEEQIVGLLSSRLPFEEHKLDAVDSLMRRIRF